MWYKPWGQVIAPKQLGNRMSVGVAKVVVFEVSGATNGYGVSTAIKFGRFVAHST
jgi:hypothetical protein